MTITGTVKDSQTLDSLPGVSILVAGMRKGTVTNAAGKFELTVADTVKNLVVSFIGYASKQISISGASGPIDVLLEPLNKSLSDVVVVGYGTQKKEDLTSAVTQVNAKDFNAGGARNAMDLIQGKVAGLTITRTSGSNPNSSPSTQLRGVASISGSNSPLVVIDGVPGGNLDLLQQSDIESITVLKDGSAAAIYGTRANGGVILVTTKHGGNGEPKYEYNGWVRKEYLSRYPKVLSAAQYREKINEGVISADNDKGSSTDWFDELINHNNVSHYHNISLTGGNANTNYRASLYYSNYEGIAKANSRQQYGGTANIFHKGFNDRLTTQVTIMMNHNRANLLGGGNWEDALFKENPTQSPYDSTNPGGYWNDNQVENVVSRLHQETSWRDQETSLEQFKTTLKIINDLSITATGSAQRNQYVDNQYKLLDSRASQNDGDNPSGGYAYKGSELQNDYLFESYLSYNSSFSKDHAISAIAGYSYQYHEEEGFNASNKGFSADETAEDDLGAGNALGQGHAGEYSEKFANTLISFYGRVNYSYLDKYLVEAILRHEGSTMFGANNKWANFPAISAGWILSKEPFMQSVKWVNNLKIRAGYGITGNQSFGNGTYPFVTLGTGGYYLYPDGTWHQTYGPSLNPNPDLKWERKKELNIGTDFGLFNNRLTGSIDWFQRRTDGLVIQATVEQPANVAQQTLLNVGELGSNGIELTLGATPVQTSIFSWHIDMTGSHARTKLLKYTNGNYLNGGGIGGYGDLGNAYNYIYPGDYLGEFFGKRFAGYDENGKWLFYDKNGQKVNVTEASDVANQTYIGNGIPKYYASLTNTFTYKNFSLRFSLRGKFGYKILNTVDLDYGNQYALPANVLQSAFTTYKQLNDAYAYSDLYLQNGNFIKLDEVTFSYNIPIKSNKYIRNVNVYVTGSNLALITSYKGNDPDFVNDTGLYPGIDGQGVYPSTRSFLLGINVGL
ncbi:hypothetical protein A9P82_12760 [Arachidicoccus ginsenosidimutans]|nr:hypothetical protein A9P82_12760 [Arachidicoccus sp. BS20]